MPNNVDSTFQTSAAAGSGQPFSFKGDMDLVFYGIRDVAAGIIESIIGGSYDASLSYVLKGCIKTSTGGTTSITGGYIFGVSKAIGGLVTETQLYNVAPQSFADPAGGDVVVCKAQAFYTPANPAIFADGGSHNVRAEWRIVFSAGASGSGDVDFTDLVGFSQGFTALSAGSGWTSVGAKYRKDLFDKVSIDGGFIISSGPPSPTVTTIPVGFRPSADQVVQATEFDGSSTYGPVTVQISASTGQVTCSTVVVGGHTLYLSGIGFFTN